MIELNEEEINNIKIKVKYFFDNCSAVHITLQNERWTNGIILELKENCFVIKDYKEGNQLIFYSDVYDIRSYVEKEKVKE